MDKKLEVKNLQISFRTQGGTLKAVRNISYDLYKGETLAIVGESGSGKSVTSKAIMGILAGNSIVEGGEILYDGQDLLKISEDEYHKIRGDKIAMIFQDPMSSLNPIMRVGQQLTEAMILKAKKGKKNAKNSFNSLLKLLGENMKAAGAGADVDEKTDTFDKFCISAIKYESEFNEAYGNVTQLDVDSENAAVKFEKQAKFNEKAELKHILKLLKLSVNPYVIAENEKSDSCINSISSMISQKKVNAGEAARVLKEVHALAEEALAPPHPYFFRMGYYMIKQAGEDRAAMPVEEMNELTGRYMAEDFMIDFIRMAELGVQHSENRSLLSKKECLPKLKEALDYFKAGKPEEHKSHEYLKALAPEVEKAIDRLSVKKNSTEYVFASALKSALDAYFDGIRRNPVEEKKYLRNKAKYDKIVQKGQTPDWELSPQVVVDLELQQENICRVIENLIAYYQDCIEDEKQFDARARVLEIIDYLKDQASRVVVKMNKSIAKAKAIKLMEEVGIPEPATRFRQYPFEFSGGMRQRIVIAIALSANPDILICDEPTTALDVTIQAQILELINEIKEKRHLSVIFITHNLGVVANMADRIAVMYAGKIVEYGTSEEIFYEPAHPYTWALLSSMPDLETSERLESIPGTPPNMIYPPKGDAFAARNVYALDIDFELEPPLFEITPTHSAATWLLHPNAPAVEMPKVIKARIERTRKERE